MCYGGGDCQRCRGEPPVIKKSDRQQCRDDVVEHVGWLKGQQLTGVAAGVNGGKSMLPIVLFEQTYEGVEAAADIGRDVYEAFDPDFNPPVASLPDECQGTITVTIHDTPLKGKS